MRQRLRAFTRAAHTNEGELIRQFDVSGVATVMTAFVGGLFLLFFLAAFLPWLLSKGMTAAVEGVMDQIGFGSFHATTIWSWLLVLLMFALFTMFIVAIATAILVLYNVLSQRIGGPMSLETRSHELLAVHRPPPAIPARTVDDPGHASFDELYAEAKRRNVRGRSTMSKDELRAALRRPARRASASGEADIG